jgi:hypothetical protein
MKNFLDLFKRFLKENGPVILISSVLIIYFYGPLLLHPQSFLLNGSGDGLKNYHEKLRKRADRKVKKKRKKSGGGGGAAFTI